MIGDGERIYARLGAALGAFLVLIALLGCAGTGAGIGTSKQFDEYADEMNKGFEAEREKDFSRALQHYQAAVDLAREGDMPPYRLAEPLVGVAWSALHLGDLERAEEAAQRAAEIYATDPPPFDCSSKQAWALVTLAGVRFERREFPKAAELLEQALRIHDETIIRHRLAWAYWELGDLDRAIVEETRVLEHVEAFAPSGLSSAHEQHYSLAAFLYARGNYDACALEQQAALTQAREWSKPDNPYLARHLTGLAVCLMELGRYDEAEPPLEEALSILENPELPEDHAGLRADTLAELARLRAKQGRVEEGRKALEEARIAQEKRLAKEPSSPSVSEELWREYTTAYFALVEANLAEAEGRRSDAVASYETSLQLYEKRFGQSSIHLRIILEEYLGALRAVGEDQRAADVERRLAAIYAQLEGEEAQ